MAMYRIETEASFDAAHFLKGYEGKCKNLHGHRWNVLVSAEGKALQTSGPKRGMLLDFGDLKAAVRALAEEFDHAFLVEDGSLKPETLKALTAEDFKIVTLQFPTTAENLSRYFYDRLKEKGYPVHAVTVYETPNNAATYDGEENRYVLL